MIDKNLIAEIQAISDNYSSTDVSIQLSVDVLLFKDD